jgi:hypothetical protein
MDGPDGENPLLGWPKDDRPAAPEEGLFVSDVELYRRLGVGPRTGRIAVRSLQHNGFPPKDPLFGNKRYWPAVRAFLDDHYIHGQSIRNAAPSAGRTWTENLDTPRTRPRPRLEATKKRAEEDCLKREAAGLPPIEAAPPIQKHKLTRPK